MRIDFKAMSDAASRASRLLAAMANDKRLMILCQLVEGERSVGELTQSLGTRQSTISQHLALLKRDGFVESRREGQSQLYSLTGDEARRVLETLYDLYCVLPRGAQS
ncbi:MAG: ArsR/SmtB family transcription factor [Gammaproteobacteria bacterium]